MPSAADNHRRHSGGCRLRIGRWCCFMRPWTGGTRPCWRGSSPAWDRC